MHEVLDTHLGQMAAKGKPRDASSPGEAREHLGLAHDAHDCLVEYAVFYYAERLVCAHGSDVPPDQILPALGKLCSQSVRMAQNCLQNV